MANVHTAQLIAMNINSKWPKPVRFMGGGANGRVYHTNDGRLMKFVYGHAPQEYKALEKLQGSFIVPRFKKGDGRLLSMRDGESKEIRRTMFPSVRNVSDYLTVFVMGRAGNSTTSMTLWQYLQKFPSVFNKANVQRRVQYLIEQLHMRGVSHGDLHANNIIVRVTPTGRISGMWAIDFGRAKLLNTGKTERESHLKLPLIATYRTTAVMPPVKQKNVPVREGSRANVHMMNAMYGLRVSPTWERRIANLRGQVRAEMKQYKSPRRTPKPRAKSLSPRRRSVGANSRRGRSASRTMP